MNAGGRIQNPCKSSEKAISLKLVWENMIMCIFSEHVITTYPGASGKVDSVLATSPWAPGTWYRMVMTADGGGNTSRSIMFKHLEVLYLLRYDCRHVHNWPLPLGRMEPTLKWLLHLTVLNMLPEAAF